jgi:hypothetical protein
MSIKSHEVYRRFVLETANSATPPRFGLTWFLTALNRLWSSTATEMDWLGFEQFTRDVLSSPLLTDGERVQILRDAVGAFTRRGTAGK